MTNNELITQLRQANKDQHTTRQQRSDATYAQILTMAQNYLNRKLDICRKAYTVTLVAEQASYELGTDFVKFPNDNLRKRGNLLIWSGGNIEPTDPAVLDREEAGWRNATSGTPTKFHVSSVTTHNSFFIGLHRKPSSTFVASVPTLTCVGIYRPAAIGANSNYPFDNNPYFADLDPLLLHHANAEIFRQDGELVKSNEYFKDLEIKLENAIEWFPGQIGPNRGFSFDPGWRT